jgi:phage protein D
VSERQNWPSYPALVSLGWQSTGLVDMGKFTVDEVEHSGAPDTITLRARAANLIDTFKQQQEHSFHKTALGAIIEAIAFRNELASGVSARLRDTAVEHIDQTHKSDATFLRRLGRKYDAVATVKNDTLLFIPINQSRTASGKALPVIPITRLGRRPPLPQRRKRRLHGCARLLA